MRCVIPIPCVEKVIAVCYNGIPQCLGQMLTHRILHSLLTKAMGTCDAVTFPLCMILNLKMGKWGGGGGDCPNISFYTNFSVP